MADELIGQTLDQYRIERALGDGTMGTVYLAHDQQNNRPVAIKVLYPTFGAQEGFQRQFLRDMALMVTLDHPNLVRIYASGLKAGRLYMVMEYLSGGSLHEYLEQHRQQKKFPPITDVLVYASQIADALHYAHDQAILHQAVKPRNILIRPVDKGEMQMVVTDLGMKQLARSALNSEAIQPEDALAYMAPELAQGLPGEAEADIYSLGVIIYNMAVGRLPFNPRTLADAIKMHTRDPVPLPLSIRQGLPVELQRIVLKTLEKDRTNRYRTAARLSRELKDLEIALQHKYPTDVQLDTDAGYSTYVSFETVPVLDIHPTQPEVKHGEMGRDRLVIASPSQPTRALAIDKDVFIVGRDLNADVVLESPMISRYHLRIERVSGGYQVTDLGSTNGAWVGSSRLPVNRTRTWPPGQFLRLADFRLIIEPAASLEITQARVVEAMRQTAEVEEVVVAAEAAPLRLSANLTPDKVTVVPGDSQRLELSILNESGRSDHFTISVPNLPADWVTVPAAPVELTDQRASILLAFNPPRESTSAAGLYSFEVHINSVTQPQAFPRIVPGQLQVEPFYGSTSEMRPNRVKGKRMPQVTITNTGNTPNTFALSGRDDDDALNFYINPTTVTLEAGQAKQIPITVSPKQRPLTGSTERYQFEVSVGDGRPDSRPEVHKGEMEVNPYITRRMITLAVLVLALFGVSTVCTVSQLIAQFRRTSEQARINAEAAATRDMAASDADGDGLTFAEEMELGTDPNLPDTDGDGLSDFVEARQFGTNPLARDSDGDVLSDGAEVNSCTSPNNPDSDGDELLDNVDPAPCTPSTPVPPTAVLPAPVG